MRPWPPATPAASSTPRQAKRPRPSGPSSAASSTTSAIAASASVSAGAGAGPGARDSPAVKRRRDAAPAASAAHGPPLAVEPQEPGVSFADVGGVDDLLEEVGRLLAHLRRPEIFRTLGVPPPRGVLLHGPPGCGKSLLARAVAGELRLPLLRVAGPELVAGVSGESEARVRDLFEQAARSAPCVLFLDEVDALAPPRAGAQREMERRIVAQLLSCLDELGRSGPDSTVPLGAGEVLVLGATSRPEALDPALRRAGRFDREIRLGIPDARAREAILGILCRSMRLAPDVDLHALAKCTPGFVGADLQALTREAALAAVSRVLDDTQRGGAEATKDNEKTAAAEERNDESEAKIKDETKASTSEEKEVSKEEKEETKMDVDKEADQEAKKDTETEKEAKKEVIENKTNESMEVIDISDRDTPNESGSSKTPAAKADSSVTKLVGIDEDEVCIEAEVTSSDAAAKDKTTKGSSTPDADDDMEVLEDELDEEVVPVPASEILHTKSLAANVWNTHFPALTDNQLENMFITQKDFEVALKHVQPSAKREGFATVPDISWDDVGALRDVREELQMAILAPVRHPDAFEALGLTAPAGLLLCGPPGCGKTLIAKAIANEADINFISVKGPELLNMYVGESEKAVRQCFLRARNSAPCVIFFDELDALCPRRTGGPSGEGSSATQRVVNQLLTEMDGVEGRRGVFLLAASNRPDILDPAVLRPGRLDRIVFVGLPGPDARAEILRALTKNGTRPRLAADVDLQTLGESADLEGCSGADLASLIREAATLALREHLVSVPSQPSSNSPRPPPAVAREHLAQAVRRLRPSERIRYEKLRIQFSSSNPIQVQSNKESPPSPSSSSASSQTAVGGAGTNANEMQTEPPKDLAPSTPADPSVSA
ncbi:Transitional endoplasmic reticulum ATPase TER94 [Gryllus bimaculatus]|nr:Transitional endoplasmic reticulum ATPase TER94 [Gryllus bimaculatus]